MKSGVYTVSLAARLLLVGTVLFSARPALAMPAGQPPACPAGYAGFSRRAQGRVFGQRGVPLSVRAELDREIRDGIHFRWQGDANILNGDWKFFRELHESRREFLSQLPSLSVVEREHYLPLVRALPAESGADRRYKDFLLLGLYDHDAWLRVASGVVEPSHSAYIAQSFFTDFSKYMPASLREEVLHRIGSRYGMYSKERLPIHNIAPKRLADLYFKQLLRGDQLIEREVQSGKTPLQAYESYVAKVQSYIQTEKPFSAESGLEVIRKLQGVLQRHPKLAGEGGEEAAFYVGGSLPNGRASLQRSDLDVSTNFSTTEAVREELAVPVEQYVQSLEPGTAFQVSFHDKLAPAYWQKVHPVVFRVTREGIQVLVYDDKGELVKTYPLR